ncbi:MAG: UDP-2,3-diacylglucosamine diphosphatase [Betaproteobacteria bacterium]|jgi:UDP-2,3-diacylglucosamine pyrophosphatase LpxH|nr:UDP-2,3-diacylglucosamine diphosphatase [Candidatus Fonsibacter lacus]
MHYRSVFISDIHLGTKGCQADALLDFLKNHTSDYLYLVGDIVDGWQLKRRWYWPQAHNDVVQKLLRKARKGCQVIFVPGNHDEFARPFAELALGDIKIKKEAVHTLLNGRRMWVIHGDEFDAVVQCAKWLAYLGDSAYTAALACNRWLNLARQKLGMPYWSLSAFLKLKVKRAVSYVNHYEQAVAQSAKRKGYDGVICGHIHHAEIRTVDGVLYCNDGDWVESLTAIAEGMDGKLHIIRWATAAKPYATRDDAVESQDEEAPELAMTP